MIFFIRRMNHKKQRRIVYISKPNEMRVFFKKKDNKIDKQIHYWGKSCKLIHDGAYIAVGVFGVGEGGYTS